MSFSPESPLIGQAAEQYHEYEMDVLPEELTRDSLKYYYLSVYPGLKQMRELEPTEQPKLPGKVETAYVHTPYCTGVCDFCSYLVKAVSADDPHPLTEYFDTVKDEIRQRAAETDLDLSYIYFGGGTPSLIPTPTLESFFDFLNENDVLSPTHYGTIEIHPEFFSDLTKAQEFVDVLKANGIGRVSVGFQSSDEAILDDTNRRHDTLFLGDAIDFLKQNGLLVNLDLIYGLPGLTLQQWERSLRDAAAANPDSISTYFLFVDPGTAMRTNVERGNIILPSHQDVQTQHLMAQLLLQDMGFLELPSDFYAKTDADPSTFTQDALPSAGASLPLGAGSYGYYDNVQFFNQFSLSKYRERIAANESPIWRGHRFEGTEGAHRDMMFSLKNSPYIDRGLFEDRYGIDPVDQFADTIEMLDRYKLVVVDDETRRITLTPKGRLCVEEICCQFAIPGLNENTAGASRSDRRKLDKHNFMPTYGIVPRPEM